MLLRIHQSGHLVNLSPARFALVKEGIACYKSIRQDIRRAVPFWPLGLSSYGDSWVSLGLKAGNKNYIAVWRSDSGNDTCLLPISHLRGKDASVKCLYPQNGRVPLRMAQGKRRTCGRAAGEYLGTTV